MRFESPTRSFRIVRKDICDDTRQHRTENQITNILADLRQLEVQRVAPSHCTGEDAIRMFADEYGDKFIRSGAGTVITI